MTKILSFNREDDDHNPRYNVESDTLMSADEKMKNISKVKEEVLQKSLSNRENVKIADDGETIIHDRKFNEYYILWDAFVHTEEPEFKESMGYGREEIEKISIFKFIDAMDWKTASDIAKWKTDKFHIIICPHCKDEFAVFEHFGLCHNCKPLYDLEKLTKVIVEVNNDNPGFLLQQIAGFVFDEEIRNMYLK